MGAATAKAAMDRKVAMMVNFIFAVLDFVRKTESVIVENVVVG
jgi:hypothetical protein